MNRLEIANKFKQMHGNSEYVRVSDSHPLELYIGKNDKGYPTLRFNGTFQPVKILGNELLEIKQVKTSSYNSILFSFNSEENVSLFYNFCEDIINKTETYSGLDGYAEIINRYNQWKKMFYGGNKLLSEAEVMGLIGELLFLKNYAFSTYGMTTGLNGWSGPEPTHKDFSFKDTWFEIKSINDSKNYVTISSIEQLDSNDDGHLIVYYVEKMSPSFNGLRLNSLVDEIMQSFTLETDKDIFADKLKQVGYKYNEVYDNYVYNVRGEEKYKVNDSFPRLRRKDLPLGIGRVTYEIALQTIEQYKEK